MKTGQIVDITDGPLKGGRGRIQRISDKTGRLSVVLLAGVGAYKSSDLVNLAAHEVSVRDLEADKRTARPSPLRDEMTVLVQWVHDSASEIPENEGDPHHILFHKAALRFNLYDAEKQAPVWLSRVVAGCLADRAEGQGVVV